MQPMINDDYINASQQKIFGQTRRLQMRGQQITPWSIYNKTIVNERQEAQKDEKEVVRFPKIHKKSGRVGQRDEWSVDKGRHSARQVLEAMKHDRQPFSPFLSEFITENQENERKRQQEMQGKECELDMLMNDRIVLQMIKAQLKRQNSQLDFMNLLKEQQAEQVIPEPTLSINTKRNRSYLLDRHPFPRVNVDKNVMLINLNNEQSPPSLEEKPAINAETIKAILKKEINSMISNRMKIMGRAKQLAFKP